MTTFRIEVFTPGHPCGEKRGPRATVVCELPPTHPHDIGHIGRARDGRWIIWPAVGIMRRALRRQRRIEETLA